MKIKMIYLAAGNSRRFLIHGQQKNKLLYPIDGIPLYQYGLEQLREVSARIKDSHIYVVTQHKEIYHACDNIAEITAVFSEESQKGMSYSIKKALEAATLDDEDASYLFLAADQPFVKADSIEWFIREFLYSGKKLGTMMYGKIPGNPTIFHQDYVQELMCLSGDQGGRKILKKYADQVFEFQLEVEKEQQDVDTLLDFQMICEQMEKRSTRKIYVAGSGGKTSLIHCLAKRYAKAGKKVLILTTTHMRKEQDMILLYEDSEESIDQIKRAFCCRSVVMAGKPADSGGKFTWIGKTLYHQVKGLADVILIEADGSKRLPAKFPNRTEPVILEDADEIYVVFGLSALGQKMKDACHRYSLADSIADAEELIDERIAAELLNRGYLCMLQKKYPNARIFLVLNQADDEILKNQAKKIAKLTGENAIIISLQKEFEKSANNIGNK
ncbi:MAG: selenium cofactor biosynthesis protein YqeC [Lachnospiraceae bacterium]|nr:selenium cofactor biosynthesis protein YqeC [Lachnospiraceae bacterium]